MEATNRKLIRPTVSGAIMPSGKESMSPPRQAPKKMVPPEQTNAENFYYMKQMQSKTPMIAVLRDGEILQGYIEWYDKTCLKFNRNNGPNLLLYKSVIKYMYKDPEAP